MTLKELCEMAALNRHDIGFGMSELSNDNFVLSGGFRSGNSSSDKTRLKYDIYDMELYNQTQDQAASKVGVVELFVNTDKEIVGLVNIELLPKFRKGGRGARIVQDIKDSTKNGLTIHDIQRKAKKFWDKVGVEYTNDQQTDGKINK